ncbi:MAG: low affinity iron permease family protein [Pyrinomonadaceae bacterium]
MNRWFRKFSLVAADGAGVFLDVHCQRCSHSYLVGARSFFNYSDTCQLWVNTATTVFTYLAVFLIQNTQNRDAKAIHLKVG